MSMDSMLTPVLTSLSTVIIQEATLLGGLGGELQSIQDELQQMMEFLKGADCFEEAHPDVKSWVQQVRDAASGIEDMLDEFKGHCTYPRSRGLRGQAQKAKRILKTPKARHELASKIQDMKKRIKDISETRTRYQSQYVVLERGSSLIMHTTSRGYDRRDDALLLQDADLVGIEKPKREVTEMLFSVDLRRSVISVVGMGGLGKTTLVKKVYDDVYVTSQFSHHAWVTVSESFKLEDLFKQAIKQLFSLDDQELHDLDVMDANGLKQEVHKFLDSKRYLVVFDDVWRETDWHAIHMAFPRNSNGSRVIITTRNSGICQAASNNEEKGSIYTLKPLPEKEARKLFCRKAFNGGNCPKHLEQICQKFLKACGGLPLAIVVVGSILASKSPRTEEWDLAYRNSGEGWHQDTTKLHSLSYYHLPYHLRICLLYLSIFPEDAQIEKMRLIRLWIAEGFVQKIPEMTIEEVAESYLNQLINRSVLQVVKFKDDGKVKAIRIHDTMRHLILDKSREQNITFILREKEQMTGSQDIVRRLAIHDSSGISILQPKIKCKSLRSLVLFEFSVAAPAKVQLLSILGRSGKLIKVLDLRGAPVEEIPDEIFELIHLSYLSLRDTKVSVIPKSIRKVQNLETLDLKGTSVEHLPIQILELRQLRHLLVNSHTMAGYSSFHSIVGCKIPYNIGSLGSLQKLCYIDAQKVGDLKIANEVGKLVQLRRLGITGLSAQDGEELWSSLEKLTELRSLHIISIYKEEVIDLQYSPSSSALTFLRCLKLRGKLEKIPQWISSLHGLTRLKLEWSRLKDKDPLKHLQVLPNLVELDLDYAYEGEGLTFRAGGFLRLEALKLVSLHQLSQVIVEDGAMPLLKSLRMEKCESMKEFPFGIQYLKCLKDLEFSDMSYAFVVKITDKDSETNKRIINVPRVVISNRIDGRWQVHLFDKKTGSFLETTQSRPLENHFNFIWQ